jgi:hypothetical protein
MPDLEQLNHFIRTGKLTPNACYYFDPPLKEMEMRDLKKLFKNVRGNDTITNPLMHIGNGGPNGSGLNELLWFETDGGGNINGWQNPEVYRRYEDGSEDEQLMTYDDVINWFSRHDDYSYTFINGRMFIQEENAADLFDKLYESSDLNTKSLYGKIIFFDPSATEQNIQDVMDYFNSINVPKGGHHWGKEDVRIVYKDYILKGKNLGIGIDYNGEDLPWGKAEYFKDKYEFIPYMEFLTQVIGFNSYDSLDKLYENIGDTQPKVGDYLLAKDNKKMYDSGEQFLTKNKPYRITEVELSAPPLSIVRALYIDDDQGHNHRLGASFYREHFILVPESLEDTEGIFNKLYEQEDDFQWFHDLNLESRRLEEFPPDGTKVKVKFIYDNPCGDEEDHLIHGSFHHVDTPDGMFVLNFGDWQTECGWSCSQADFPEIKKLRGRCYWVDINDEEVYLENASLVEQEDDSLEWARELINYPVFKCKDIINDLETGDEILVSGDFTDDENNVMLSVNREPFIVDITPNKMRTSFKWVRPISQRQINWEEVSTISTSGANIKIDLNMFPKDGDLEIEIIKKNTHPF